MSKWTRTASTLLGLFAAAICLCADRSPAAEVILDRTAYWRYHFSARPILISPAQMRVEGKTSLGDRLFARTRATTIHRLGSQGRKNADWMAEVVYHPKDGLPWDFRTSAAPAGWEKPDFDDSGWARQRCVFPLDPHRTDPASGRWGAWGSGIDNVYIACFRSAFEVTEPSAVKGLTLSVAYRGGVRAFLNGHEVGRRHLPAGKLLPGDDAFADDYPIAAYTGNPGLRLRRWRTPLPREPLRRGRNVLAVEVRASRRHPIVMTPRGRDSHHLDIVRMELRAQGAGIVSPLRRPPGVQVWCEDIHHRVYSPEFCPAPQTPPRAACVVGPARSVGAVQLVIGTDRELSGLRSAVSDLRSPAGGTIRSRAATVLYPAAHPVLPELQSDGLVDLGEGGNVDPDRGARYQEPPLTAPRTRPRWLIGDEVPFILDRHASLGPGVKPDLATHTPVLKRIKYFDHLRPDPPERIPADTCQPVWISLWIPAATAAGSYRGAVTVSAAGIEPVTVPLEVEVAGWQLGPPTGFRTVLAIEQSPYGIAKHYGVPLWSKRHFELMEPSFRLLGLVGNNWLNVPVLSYTEFGNREDSPVRITRRRSGSYTCDFTRLDGYLDLAVRHWGTPRVIDFVVNQPLHRTSNQVIMPPVVRVVDEATGRREMLEVGRAMPAGERRGFWRDVSTAIYGHMKSRGLEHAMYWGLPWDRAADPKMPELLAEFVPDVRWTRQGHGYAPDQTYAAVSMLYGHNLGLRSCKGWKRKSVCLLFTRTAGDVISCYGSSPPFTYRILMDRALVAGANGIARYGADYFDGVWMSGFRSRIFCPGLTCLRLLWEGPKGAESSIRFEVPREAVQEAEARIYLEDQTDRMPSGDLKSRITRVLEAHSHDTLLLHPRRHSIKMCEYSTGWQERSRRLYQTAADVAAGRGR